MLFKTKEPVNFRDEKKINRIIVMLGKGEDVELIEKTDVVFSGYSMVKAKTRFGIGLVAEKFLTSAIEYIKPKTTNKPHIFSKKEVTLESIKAVQKDGRINYDAHLHPVDTCKEIMTAIGYKEKFEAVRTFLNVEKSPCFKPQLGSTYCNIYAYQFAYLMNAYIPRVFWINPAPNKTDVVEYGKTVGELNANALFDWFVNYGREFGWVVGTPDDAKERLTIAIVKGRIGHIAVFNPDCKTTTEAGAKLYKVNTKWKSWFDSKKYSGSLIFTYKPN